MRVHECEIWSQSLKWVGPWCIWSTVVLGVLPPSPTHFSAAAVTSLWGNQGGQRMRSMASKCKSSVHPWGGGNRQASRGGDGTGREQEEGQAPSGEKVPPGIAGRQAAPSLSGAGAAKLPWARNTVQRATAVYSTPLPAGLPLSPFRSQRPHRPVQQGVGLC